VLSIKCKDICLSQKTARTDVRIDNTLLLMWNRNKVALITMKPPTMS